MADAHPLGGSLQKMDVNLARTKREPGCGTPWKTSWAHKQNTTELNPWINGCINDEYQGESPTFGVPTSHKWTESLVGEVKEIEISNILRYTELPCFSPVLNLCFRENKFEMNSGLKKINQLLVKTLFFCTASNAKKIEIF